jgi:hypothetical protein
MTLIGSEVPRLWTPPLRALTPETSAGFEVIEFAESLDLDLMPWQRWLLTAGLELREDGTYRFRNVVVLVSRQNGKTTVAKLLSLWSMTTTPRSLVLGTSTNLETARESWEAAVELAEDFLPDQVGKVKRGALDTSLRLVNGSRYKVAAANRRGGRGLSVDLGLADELREHQSWDAWGAMAATTTARPNPQIWALSNAGDDTSVVLNHLRDSALGGGDDSLALFEWSAEDGCELDDRDAWVQANPALGHTITERTLESLLAASPPAVFRTEHLCQRVATLDSAIDLNVWRESADTGSMDGLRDRVALCLDVSLDMEHVTLVAAAVTGDGKVRTDVVAEWDSVNAARADLPELIERVKPRAFGWFPNGPGATLAADLKDVKNAAPIKDVAVACMGLAEQVTARRVIHSNDPLVAAQMAGTTRLWQGDGWRFARKGGVGHCDAVYALAGAVHLARTLPKPVGKPRLSVAA